MTNKSNFEVLDALQQLQLEQTWLEATRTTLQARPIEDYLQLAFAENTKLDDSIDVIRQFTLLVEKGITPPASILNTLAIRFRKYLKTEPFDSLDAAFNLKRKQSVGHPLDHRLAIEERGRVICFMWCLRYQATLNGEKLSIESAAAEAINKLNLDVSESVLEKNYVDKKADDIFGQAFEELNEALKKVETKSSF